MDDPNEVQTAVPDFTTIKILTAYMIIPYLALYLMYHSEYDAYAAVGVYLCCLHADLPLNFHL